MSKNPPPAVRVIGCTACGVRRTVSACFNHIIFGTLWLESIGFVHRISVLGIRGTASDLYYFRVFRPPLKAAAIRALSISYSTTPHMSRHNTAPMSPPMITLYDVPSHNTPQPWAPNIWRIRFILNYKRLPYRTAWVEFPDVETTLRSIGAPPSAVRSDGRPVYTLPVIVDPLRSSHRSPEVLSNTNTIAEYLEATYPARPVFPEGSRALQSLFVHYIQEVFAKPLLPIMVPLSHQRLPARSQHHFRGPEYPASAAAPQTLPPGPQREQAWLAVQEQFNFLAIILDKNAGAGGDGVVAMGRDLSYADFALCSVLIWIQRMAPLDGWSRVRTWNGGRWSRLWDRCREFMDEL